MLLAAACISCGSEAHQTEMLPRVMTLADGTRFAVVGVKPASPAPTLFLFALDCETTLRRDEYSHVAKILAVDGFVSVSIDLPCHGADRRKGEPEQLAGWRARADRNEPLVAGFVAKASAVLDYLVNKGYTDPDRVAVCGTSRGGFMAFHFAAAEARVKCAVGFSPVSDLLRLREFADSRQDGMAASLKLENVAGKLAGRALWICIGNDDPRVSTDAAITFARAAIKASAEAGKPVLVELHVIESCGHSVPMGAHKMAANWIREHLLSEN